MVCGYGIFVCKGIFFLKGRRKMEEIVIVCVWEYSPKKYYAVFVEV